MKDAGRIERRDGVIKIIVPEIEFRNLPVDEKKLLGQRIRKICSDNSIDLADFQMNNLGLQFFESQDVEDSHYYAHVTELTER
jgi:hypothetical protein